MRSVLLSAIAACVLATLAANAEAQNNESTSFIPAQITITPEAAPPPEVLETGLGGTVRVKVSIDAGGAVTSADEVTGPDHTCQQITRADVVAMRSAAKAAALTARFNPATDKGTPIASSTWLSFKFPGASALPEVTRTAAPANGKYTISSPPPETAGQKIASVEKEMRPEGSSPAPGPTTTPKPARTLPKQISGGVLNGKAINLVKPPYPAAARAVKAAGEVTVHVLIDEEGNIFAAEGIAGHPLLRSAAMIAACESKFSPTQLMGQPVKVSGVIVYNFVP